MTTTLRPLPAILLLGLALLTAACSGAGGSPSASPRPSTQPSASPAPPAGGMVDATGDWTLTSGTNAGAAIPIVPGSDITLTVAGTQVSGQSACNSYGGEVIVKDGVVQFGPLMSTEMACADPIMASEAAYVAALAGVRAASLEGDKLTLTGPGVELSYERVVPGPAAPLVGTTWVLDTIVTGDAASSVIGEPATLQLSSDGTINGSTGCRTFIGSYAAGPTTMAGSEVATSGLATDRRACAPDVAAQDELVLAVLGTRFAATVDGQRLAILGQNGQGLGFAVRDAGAPSAS